MRGALLLIPVLLLTMFAAACQDEASPESDATPSPAGETPAAPETETPAPTVTPSPQAGEEGALTFETALEGSQSGILDDPDTVVAILVRDQQEWEDLWDVHQKITPGGGRLRPAPEVDFPILAVFDQRRSTGGYSLEITRLVEADGYLLVSVAREVPGENCITTQVLTRPFHMVSYDGPDDLEVFVGLPEDHVVDC